MVKVITYGTFDLFHVGHYNILKRAKEQGDYLIVGVTSENYDIERGKLNVKDSLLTRINNVKATGLADEIIIEEYQGQKISDVVKYNIDILVIGSDWRGKFDYLKKYCEVRYLERTKNISSTQLREEGKSYAIGIVTDTAQEDDVVIETKYVSGMHVNGVYSRDRIVAEEYGREKELNFSTDDYDEFLEKTDIIYIRTKQSTGREYYDLMMKAVEKGKHIVCNMSNLESEDQAHRIFELAEKNGCIICEDMVLAYTKAFDQLLWYIKGDVIGDIISVSARIRQDDYDTKNVNEIYHLLNFAMTRILGSNLERIFHFVHDKSNYESIHAITDVGEFNAGISLDVGLKNSMEIFGSKGYIYIPDEWWRMQYFKIENYETGNVSRYGFNFEGTGYRYILMSLLSMLESQRKDSCKVFYSETENLLKIKKYMKKNDLTLLDGEEDDG